MKWILFRLGVFRLLRYDRNVPQAWRASQYFRRYMKHG